MKEDIKVENVSGVCETLGVRYETVYANGTRFLVVSKILNL